ncbi:phage tail protein [Enterobacter cloacae]|uniref:phage tail fiber protein n=1 Tax=Enterobacter cloacae TaxID=550 RepID=UPI00339D1F46
MIYTTGTIAISGNTLTGTGTNFTAAGSLIRNGCTVIALTSPAQVFQITAIGGATSLTVTPAANPAIPAGTKYAILLSDSLSVDGLAQDIAETFTMYQRYMSGFADVMNGTTDVTITINGVPVTVPGQKSLAKKGANSDITSLSGLTTALSISQGGTGANNAADARTNLGLGTSATKAAGTSNGNVIQVGGFGIGADASLATQLVSLADGYRAGIYRMRGDGTSSPTVGVPSGSGNAIIGLMSVPVYSNAGFGFAFNQNNIWTGTFDPANPSAVTWKKWWGEANTTVDTNGFIKRASPVVKLYGSGEIECNDEAEGVAASREAAGVYRVTGSCGLNSEGWTVEIPQDINGNFLCFVDITTEDDGVLTVSVFRRRFDVETAMIIAGDPMDIPEGRWIDLRLEMPEDSIWNRRQKEVIDVALQEPAS